MTSIFKLNGTECPQFLFEKNIDTKLLTKQLFCSFLCFHYFHGSAMLAFGWLRTFKDNFLKICL